MFITLDPEQSKAINSQSPTLIHASAGSGKTRCLVAKIGLLLHNGINPENICAITFTNKAANEMKNRIKSYYSISIKEMQVSTIHSLCVRVIRTFIHHTFLNNPFSIYDEGDQLSIIKTIVKARNLPGQPYEYMSVISFAKSQDTEDKLEKDFFDVYKAYQDILFKNNACDFDDLLIYAYDCLKHKDCSDYYSKLWPHVLVDEFQDTSTIQYEIIKKLHNPETSKTLFIIGDGNQSLYGWRGAKPENINDFIKDYKPTICNLTYNYRSASEIITHANNFLQFGKPMITKKGHNGRVSFTQFLSQEDEAENIAKALLKMGDYENTAILFRVNTRSLLFEKAFTKMHIPYKIVGALPYYRRAVAKTLLSYLKASLNRSDLESLIRIINTPKRGFGEAKQEKLLHEGWPYLLNIAREMPIIQSLINLLNTIHDLKPIHAINEILLKTNYKGYLKKDSDILMLDSFINVASSFDSINELILASTFLEEDSGHGVKLMTAHSSKGLEFKRVFVVGLEEGLWPHSLSNNLAEEERLYYVACTRAENYLNISYSKSKLYRGQIIQISPSYLFIDSYKKYKKS